MVKSTLWFAESILELDTLIREKKSNREIAAALTKKFRQFYSPNAVAGKSHRRKGMSAPRRDVVAATASKVTFHSDAEGSPLHVCFLDLDMKRHCGVILAGQDPSGLTRYCAQKPPCIFHTKEPLGE